MFRIDFFVFELFSMHLTIDSNFQDVPFWNMTRSGLKMYKTEHTFLEFQVDCGCSIIILFQCTYHINFSYHLMLVVNSKFSTRVFFFRMLFMLILVIFLVYTHARAHISLRNHIFELHHHHTDDEIFDV